MSLANIFYNCLSILKEYRFFTLLQLKIDIHVEYVMHKLSWALKIISLLHIKTSRLVYSFDEINARLAVLLLWK